MIRNVAGGWAVLIALAAVAGCNPSAPPPSKDDEELKEAFVSFQKALKAKDADKLWALLDEDSQAEGDRADDANSAALTNEASARSLAAARAVEPSLAEPEMAPDFVYLDCP